MTDRGRAWCFTLNNPSGEEAWDIDCEYMIRGNEVGEQGTPHIQGYIYFKNAILFKSVKKRLPSGCHIEKAMGSSLQNREYCSKDKDFVEVGVCPKQGSRSDISTVKELVSQGKGMRAITAEVNSYQAMRCGELLLKYHERKRDWKPEVYWFYGSTGTGKTRAAMEMLVDPWISNKNLKWWEGYDAHDDVCIDDFRGDFCTFHELLRILDRYPYRIECKGSSRQLLAKRIVITSPFHPSTVYATREDIEQLLRRIDVIRNFDTEVMTQKSGVILNPDFEEAI